MSIHPKSKSSSYSDQFCSVCGDVAESMHFGAVSCRACSIFFKRKIVSQRSPLKRCDSTCELSTVLRKLCASCRFSKCLAAGMTESAVCRRVKKSNSHDLSSPTSSAILPLLAKLQSAYEKLEMARFELFHKEKKRAPEMCNYATMNELMLKDADLILNHMDIAFVEVDQVSRDQRRVLFCHFLVPFLFIEMGYKSTNSGNRFLLSNGDYVCFGSVNKYYESSNEQNKQADQKAAQIFRPYWKYLHEVLKSEMDETQLDLVEFLTVVSLVFWECGLPGQTEDCHEACQSMRSKLLSELSEYEKTKKASTDPSLRVGQVLMLLQTIQRGINLFHEEIEVSLIYNLYERHYTIFDTVTKI